jgi:hypothetical protein
MVVNFEIPVSDWSVFALITIISFNYLFIQPAPDGNRWLAVFNELSVYRTKEIKWFCCLNCLYLQRGISGRRLRGNV